VKTEMMLIKKLYLYTPHLTSRILKRAFSQKERLLNIFTKNPSLLSQSIEMIIDTLNYLKNGTTLYVAKKKMNEIRRLEDNLLDGVFSYEKRRKVYYWLKCLKKYNECYLSTLLSSTNDTFIDKLNIRLDPEAEIILHRPIWVSAYYDPKPNKGFHPVYPNPYLEKLKEAGFKVKK
jgi:hypothetical protein